MNASCFSTMEKVRFIFKSLNCLYIFYGILSCQNKCLQFSVCLFMYETGVLRACKRFLFLFAVVFLREAKERA